VILLTVGTQLPFNRLVVAADEWCRSTGRGDIVGQVGALGPKDYRPERFRQWSEIFAPQRLDMLCREAELIVAHAGMGSIITALRYARPIVIMPRRAALGEHRNDHQLATAARFCDRPGVYVAGGENELASTIERALVPSLVAHSALQPFAQPTLLKTIRSFIWDADLDQTDR
jgi:UDP-N-acetylglucosamine transferase subunit ALG13